MAIICRQHNLLFIMTPRTACTAIGDLLCKHYGGEFLPSEDILDSAGRVSVPKKHSTLSELIKSGLLTSTEASALLKVATVRNPFDTLVSLYFKQKYKYQPLLEDKTSWVNRSPTYARNMRYAQTHSFSRWILRKCSRQIAKRCFGIPPSMFYDYTCGVDVVMRYENINADLHAALESAGMPTGVPIPVVNETTERTRKDYRSSYSRLTASAVRVAFSEDIERYGYRL
jgi:hypothetical protein